MILRQNWRVTRRVCGKRTGLLRRGRSGSAGGPAHRSERGCAEVRQRANRVSRIYSKCRWAVGLGVSSKCATTGLFAGRGKVLEVPGKGRWVERGVAREE